jgi:hypothetical protein
MPAVLRPIGYSISRCGNEKVRGAEVELPTPCKRLAKPIDGALFDAISVCALFKMMNRIVLGSGILEDPRLRPPEDVEARRLRMGQPGDDTHTAGHSYGRLAEIPELP